jgi:hypothetical protein
LHTKESESLHCETTGEVVWVVINVCATVGVGVNVITPHLLQENGQ